MLHEAMETNHVMNLCKILVFKTPHNNSFWGGGETKKQEHHGHDLLIEECIRSIQDPRSTKGFFCVSWEEIE